MLAGVGAFFQVHVHLAAGNNLQRIGAGVVQLVHAGDEQGVGLFLHGVDVDDMLVQLFGVLEIGKLHHHFTHSLTAVHHHLGQGQRFGAHRLHVVVIDADKHILNFIGELVDTLAEQGDILALNRRDKRFYKGVRQLVFLFVCSVLYRMDLVQLLRKLGRVEVLHRLLQKMGCLARELGAGNEVFEIKRICFF